MSLKKKRQSKLNNITLSVHEATRLMWLHVEDIPETTFNALRVLEKDATATDAFCVHVYNVLKDCNLLE